MPISGPPLDRPVVIHEMLRSCLESRPDDIALVSVTTTRTWRQLDDISQRLATSYLDLGLKPGDRVASLMPNRASLLVHYLACFKAGLIATPLNYRYMAPEMDHALEVSGASILLAHVERAADIAKSELAGKLPLGIVSFHDDEVGRLTDGPTYQELVDPAMPTRQMPAPAPDAGAAIFFTSGSTGKPKGVYHTHETLGWMFAAINKTYGFSSDDIMLPGCSCSHIAAFALSLGCLAAGARVDVARNLVGEELLKLLRETRPTALLMLPAALYGLVRDHDAKPEDFASLRLCISGGDKVSQELDDAFVKLAGIDIIEAYGMSEIGVATANPPEGGGRIGSIGKICPGYQLSVRDEDRNEVPVGTEGRLWAKFPGICVGYWNRPDATAETIVDGWLDTGDIVVLDEDGYFWFRGRKKQIIVHDGSNICPQEVEESLLAYETVGQVAVIGVHNLVHGETVRAYITLVEGSDRPKDETLIMFSRERVGYKAPEEIVILGEMPFNATGKVDRLFLKQLACKEHEYLHTEMGIPY
jgi:acyl-CoA synthetase (AMP-forming)/AMP-acid ligase II